MAVLSLVLLIVTLRLLVHVVVALARLLLSLLPSKSRAGPPMGPEPPSGVREPRRPGPRSGAGFVELD